MQNIAKKAKLAKKTVIEIAAVSGAFALVAVLSAFYDLQISKALYNPDLLFGQFFAYLGELPSYLAAPTVGAIFFHQSIGKNRTAKIAWKVFSVIIVAAGWFYLIFAWVWENFVRPEIDFAIVYQLYFTAMLTIATLLGTAKVDKKAMKRLLLFAIFVMLVAAISNALIQIFKLMWQRQRFRTMVDNPQNAGLIAAYGGNYRGFAPWYKPEFLFRTPFRTEAYIAAVKDVDHDAFKSFPSGHTVAASASFALIILPEMYEKLKKYRWMFWTFPALYTVVVGISRIVIGAHYLSDVLFGGFIGFGIAVLARWIIVKKQYNVKANNWAAEIKTE
ncbi:MAG: phosphatase PAP2 family protein [Clostridia bacterium]